MQNKAVSSLDLNKIDFFFLPSSDWCQTLQEEKEKRKMLMVIKLGELLQPGFLRKKKESRKWEREKKKKGARP